MKQLFLIVTMVVLAACQQEEPLPETGLAGYDPHLIENQSAACEKRGGRFAQGGLSGNFVCYETTKDANNRCSNATDCEGLCLARSRTCTPVKPLYGCHDVLTIAGTVSTLCIE